VPSYRARVSSNVIASAASRAEAQATVDFLWSRGLREGLSIVGTDLRLADRPRRSVARSTGVDAAQGAGIGLLIAILIASFAETNTNGFLVVLWGLLYGALFGALRGFFRALSHPAPEPQPVATRFEVWCAPEDERVARRLLAGEEQLPDAA
jgi:hypothetical protein